MTECLSSQCDSTKEAQADLRPPWCTGRTLCVTKKEPAGPFVTQIGTSRSRSNDSPSTSLTRTSCHPQAKHGQLEVRTGGNTQPGGAAWVVNLLTTISDASNSNRSWGSTLCLLPETCEGGSGRNAAPKTGIGVQKTSLANASTTGPELNLN